MSDFICELCNEKKIRHAKNKCKKCYLKCRPKEVRRKQAIIDGARRNNRLGRNYDDSIDISYKNRKSGMGSINRSGYKLISRKDHPNARKDGKIFEHVFVMSEYLKRPLSKVENVHHKNGNKLDNDIKNLELWTTKQPYGCRVKDLIDFCKEFLNKYKNEEDKL